MSTQWEEISRLFWQALEIEPNHRLEFLRNACGGNDALLNEVQALISAHAQAESFIESSPLDALMRARTIRSLDPEGEQHVGNYKLRKEIGRGGMGVVYLAVRADDTFQKRVAIKLLKPGMDSEAILQRFRRERQILAALDHPHIARLLDGGSTPQGTPYFVMEYIEGKPLLSYCDAEKLLTAKRLELFLAVCSAVHYAHQKSVVHRDLKPTNLLVTSEGVVKLLDFGIAKFLNPELLGQTLDPTVTGLRAMTPEYASPEQIRGEPITTSSDIYSLGVLLYELLTGHRPYRLKNHSSEELARAICELDPEKPSAVVARTEQMSDPDGIERITATPDSVSQVRDGDLSKLRRALSGDLDAIVLKALRKERQNRYTSTVALADDIRRYLEARPVHARQGSLTYLTAKFIKRQKSALIAAAVAIGIAAVALVVGMKLSQRQGPVGPPAVQPVPSVNHGPLSPEAKAALASGRELTAILYRGNTSEIWARMTTEMRNATGTEEKLQEFWSSVDHDFGTEVKILDEEVKTSSSYHQYLRTASFSNVTKPIQVEWFIDSNGKIHSFSIMPVMTGQHVPPQ